MYRKLAISGVSLLALMTLVVSAQVPNGYPNQAFPPPVGTSPTTTAPAYGVPFTWSDGATRREEIELDHKSKELVKKLAKAEGENKEKTKTQLTEILGKQFDVRQKRHQDEIEALEKQLKKLKDLVQKRQENRREIISKRLEQLGREAEGLGW